MSQGMAAYKDRHVTLGPGWMYHDKSSTLLQSTFVKIPGFPLHYYPGSNANYTHKVQVQSTAEGLKWNHGNEKQGRDLAAQDFYEQSAAGSPETNFVFVHNFGSKQFSSTDNFHQKMNFAKLQGMGCHAADGPMPTPSPFAPTPSPLVGLVSSAEQCYGPTKNIGGGTGFGYTFLSCTDAVIVDSDCSTGFYSYSESYNGQCKCALDDCTERMHASSYNIYRVLPVHSEEPMMIV